MPPVPPDRVFIPVSVRNGGKETRIEGVPIHTTALTSFLVQHVGRGNKIIFHIDPRHHLEAQHVPQETIAKVAAVIYAVADTTRTITGLTTTPPDDPDPIRYACTFLADVSAELWARLGHE